MQDNTMFFQVTVMDNQDPMMLGRIRAKLLIDNYDDIVRSITDPPWNEQKETRLFLVLLCHTSCIKYQSQQKWHRYSM
jgi:hypothetical protein